FQLGLQLADVLGQLQLLRFGLGFRLRLRLSRRGDERHQQEDAEQEDKDVDERDKKASDAPAGAFDHRDSPRFGAGPPAKERMRSRPMRATQVGRMFMSAMKSPLPVAVMAGA